VLAAALGLLAFWTACGPVATAPPKSLTTDTPATTTAISAALTQVPVATIGAPPSAAANSGTPTTLSEAELVQRIQALLDGRSGRYSVVVEMQDGDVRFRNRPDVPIEAASLYKLAIMVELFTAREAGFLSFDDTITLRTAHFLDDTGEQLAIGEVYPIGTLLELMVTTSSNVAAAALLDRVGNGNINATMARLGLTNTEIRWMPGGSANGIPTPEPTENGEIIYNITSAGDMGLLFRELLAGEVVSPEASAEMLQLLTRQVINDRLPVLLPFEAVVAHKTGNLPGLYHDVGVIYTPTGPAVVAVLTEGAEEVEAVGFMAQLGSLLYYGDP
jgi:beta-lactamase class A